MKVRHSGIGHNKVRLTHLATLVADTARGNMKRAAKRIEDKAKIMVPEDTGALKDSIRIEKSYGIRGRLQIDVVVGGQTTMIKNKNGTTREVDLDQYAMLVHESYETAVAPNGPGENTRKKMAANPGVRIGSGFLRRAAEEEYDTLIPELIAAINMVIKRNL